MTTRAVFSTSPSVYQDWQSDLLIDSYRANGGGKITRLVSIEPFKESKDTTRSVPDETFYAQKWRSPVPGDDYVPGNKPSALAEWLNEKEVPERDIMVLDPDNVFVSPLPDREPMRGRPRAQKSNFMGQETYSKALSRIWRDVSKLDPVSVPIVAHQDDLRTIAPLWRDITGEIRRVDRDNPHSWISEMWAYAIASAVLGYKHDLMDVAALDTEDLNGRPIVHYSYGYESPSWRWNKRDYLDRRPARVNPPLTERIPSGLLATLESLKHYGVAA